MANVLKMEKEGLPVQDNPDVLQDIERFFRSGQEWLRKQNEAGISGIEFCRSRSSLLDGVLKRLWKRAVAESAKRELSPGLALCAVGGYGREELCPFSDIDLLMLHAPGKGR
ncbi:MAG TPA: hypothetical protein VLS90_02870, partial [Thermodesulfobacteriota bacterium]|nr:hypothetical protein [Thermodesulfobacteriota bacterium]